MLRRIIRRAVLHAYLLGARDLVLPAMVDAAVDVMGAAYPEIVDEPRDRARRWSAARSRRSARRCSAASTCSTSSSSRGDVSGADAFFLHDTLGFPIDLTREIAAERGRAVDVDGFEQRMAQQRARARAAADEAGRGAPATAGDLARAARRVRRRPSSPGARSTSRKANVVALVVDGARVDEAGEGATVEVVLDRTPFYAESGGQVGDTGTITHGRCRHGARARRARHALRHRRLGRRARVRRAQRRDPRGRRGRRRDRRACAATAIRRNHTATHILHWALREVLGSHVQQAGSMVAPDRLRFDFSHHDAVTPEQLAAGRAARQRAGHLRRAGAPLRDHEGRGRAHRRDRVLRREVRRDRARARGGTLDRAVRRHARVRARLHRADQDRERELDRLEPAPHRGGHRRRRARRTSSRRKRCSAGSARLLRAAPKEIPEKIERLSEQVRALQDELQRLQGEGGASRRRPSSRRRRPTAR